MNTNKPRATFCYLFGREFHPEMNDLHLAFETLFELHKKILDIDDYEEYFSNVPVRAQELLVPERIEFITTAKEIVLTEYPGAFTLNALGLDQKNGKDMSIYAIWDGDSAITAKQYFRSIS